MSDLISRQAAIDAVSRGCQEFRGIFAECEKNLNALPAVQTCDDAVSRQAAIDALWKALYAYEDKTERQFQESDELKVDDWIVHRIFVQNMSDIDRQTILNLPAVQPQRKTDEWCTDCQEYDSEKHCCPRWNRVIRQTLKDAQPELIRCRDCKFQDKGLNESESWNLCGYRPWLHVPTEDEHYCGYAKRRTE